MFNYVCRGVVHALSLRNPHKLGS